MTCTQESGDSQNSSVHIHLSEFEILEIVKKAAEQYEEYIRLAELAKIADYQERPEVYRPRYSWKAPLGLVIDRPPNVKLI